MARDREFGREVIEFSAIAKARLSAICRDLVNIYADPARCEDEPVCRLSEDTKLCLLIGHHASVRIDEERGVYILTVNTDGPHAITLETASDDVLVDHIISYLARDRSHRLSLTGHGLISALVGQTLDSIERSLILATLRQHHFNRTRAAETLGISVRTIRNKLKSYRAEDGADGRNSDVFRLRGSSPLSQPFQTTLQSIPPSDR
jgi:DNA-binding protein Fis